MEARKAEESKVILKAIIDAAHNQTDGHWPRCVLLDTGTERHPLDAFQNNRPTAIMDAFREAAKNK